MSNDPAEVSFKINNPSSNIDANSQGRPCEKCCSIWREDAGGLRQGNTNPSGYDYSVLSGSWDISQSDPAATFPVASGLKLTPSSGGEIKKDFFMPHHMYYTYSVVLRSSGLPFKNSVKVFWTDANNYVECEVDMPSTMPGANGRIRIKKVINGISSTVAEKVPVNIVSTSNQNLVLVVSKLANNCLAFIVWLGGSVEHSACNQDLSVPTTNLPLKVHCPEPEFTKGGFIVLKADLGIASFSCMQCHQNSDAGEINPGGMEGFTVTNKCKDLLFLCNPCLEDTGGYKAFVDVSNVASNVCTTAACNSLNGLWEIRGPLPDSSTNPQVSICQGLSLDHSRASIGVIDCPAICGGIGYLRQRTFSIQLILNSSPGYFKYRVTITAGVITYTGSGCGGPFVPPLASTYVFELEVPNGTQCYDIEDEPMTFISQSGGVNQACDMSSATVLLNIEKKFP